VAVVSLSNDFPVLDCHIHRGIQGFIVAQVEVRSLVHLHTREEYF
jgi:hypothetical protein